MKIRHAIFAAFAVVGFAGCELPTIPTIPPAVEPTPETTVPAEPAFAADPASQAPGPEVGGSPDGGERQFEAPQAPCGCEPQP